MVPNQNDLIPLFLYHTRIIQGFKRLLYLLGNLFSFFFNKYQTETMEKRYEISLSVIVFQILLKQVISSRKLLSPSDSGDRVDSEKSVLI